MAEARSRHSTDVILWLDERDRAAHTRGGDGGPNSARRRAIDHHICVLIGPGQICQRECEQKPEFEHDVLLLYGEYQRNVPGRGGVAHSPFALEVVILLQTFLLAH